MGTKTIGLRKDVYERLRARKRDDESFTDLVDRLIDVSTADWRETFGTLPTEEGDELEAIARQSREMTGQGRADRQRAVVDAFADTAGPEDTDGD
jgi:predicted CopG family antitoxin